jgi:hypothetical protein
VPVLARLCFPIADFARVTVTQQAPDRVALAGAGGRAKTGLLKVSLGYVRHVTEDAVRRHLAGIVAGAVTRYHLPDIAALNFVLHDARAGGVTRPLALDAHGKSLAWALLSLELPDDDVQTGA